MFYRKDKELIFSRKQEILTAFLALACLLLFAFFPAEEALEKITSSFIFLFVLPALYIKLILRKKMADFGWKLGEWKPGLVFSAAYLAASAII
ncbi:MAG TPA: hypothetical protein DIT25_02140, partial [Candidatus Moranbacteria bacterium]|nr:hypothetical protein [Candidatus Moranbacteria bacterium]